MKTIAPPIAPRVFESARSWRRVTALSLAALLVPAAQLDLLAQQPGAYYGQYPQPAYGQQPSYGQQQPSYNQQPYYGQQQPSYGQQPYYSQQQPSYGQQPYYPPQPAQTQAYSQPPYYPQQQPNYSQQQQSYGQQAYPQQPSAQYGQNAQPQPINLQQLDQLVAPIALYPDPLVAQVLTASTYPAQIAEADRWLQTQGPAAAEQIAAGANAQNWDPSVKALTAFPQVLAQLDRNPRWTADLGNAYYNQPQDLLAAVQDMRARAQSAGNLQSNADQTVSYNQGNIEVAPANAQVVYVPAYNPWLVYGAPISPYAGYSFLGAVGSFLGAAVQFGLGVGIGPFSQLPFGWVGWGLNWLLHAVLFHNSFYVSHSNSVFDRGFAYGGRRAYANGWNRGSGLEGQGHFNGGYSSRGYSSGFGRPTQAYNNRPVQAYNNRPVQQAYNHVQPSLSARSSSFGGYQAPSSGFARNNLAQASSGGFGGQHFAGFSSKAPSSGGSHGFGGGHAPKAPSGGGHFGGGHSGGGHSGGGGHWFGKHH